MAELTREQLIEEAKLKIAVAKCYPNSEMARVEGELFKIALASLEAEPVAWLHSDNGLGIPAVTRSKNVADSWLSKGWYVQPLYIAQPVPIIPDEVLSAIRKIARIRADFEASDGDRRGISDCLEEAEQELIVTINKYATQITA